MNDVKNTYGNFHKAHNPLHVYPTEWVLRTMLGNYPNLKLDKTKYSGSKILDIGFGDGRNWPIFRDVGLNIHGIEISEKIVELGQKRAEDLGWPVTLNVGTNASIPYENSFFDYILACHSCYYVDKGTTFSDNLNEFSRVLKPGGIFIASLPEKNASIFQSCTELEDDHVKIGNDPWGLRNGYIFKWFSSEEDIIRAFSPRFYNFSIGLCCDNYFGLKINVFILVCQKTE